MVTAVVSVGVYCPQTGVTHYRQYWLHGGPFDAPSDVVGRIEGSVCAGPEDRLDRIETRESAAPSGSRWDQLSLDV